jgi:TolB-like protein/DNA-binding winged helix-turn-helix (wHTH) protein/tetratricopeptide (TPR) repeat protein
MCVVYYEGSSARTDVASRRIKIGEWIATPALNRLESAERAVDIEPRAMDLLVCLADRAGEVLATNDLITEVWRGRVVGDHSVYRLIQQLRMAFGDDPHAPRYIATVTRRGYRLIAPVETIPDPAFPARLARLRRLVPGERVRVAMVLASGITVGALLVAGLWSRLGTDRPSEGQTIAVLPFSNLSSGASNNHLGEGIAGEIIHALSNGSGLRVLARTSSFSFRDSGADISEIATRLGASVILEGSVRRENDQLRVISQLVDADTGEYLWSVDVDRPIGDLITVEREIALAVAERLVGKTADTTRMTAALPPVNGISAYEYYLLGRERMHIPSGLSREWSLDDANRAVEFFRRAIAADPNFARAYTGFADALLSRAVIGRGFSGPDEIPGDVAEEVLAAIDRADTLAPGLAETRASRGLAARVLQQNDERAFELYREAIALNPNLVRAYYNLARGVQGEEGLAALEKAVQLDPMSAELHLWLARILRDLGRSQEAQPHLAQAMRLENPPLSAFLLASGYQNSIGQKDEAIRLLEPLVDDPRFSDGQTEIRLALARLYMDLEDFPSAQAWLDSSEQTNRARALRVSLAIATGRDKDAAELVHRWQATELAALWEMLVGHDDHARTLFDGLKLDNDDTFFSDFIAWGYHPGVNSAHLLKRGGNLAEAAAQLNTVRGDIEPWRADAYARGGAYYLLASMEAIQGRKEAALAALEQAFESGWNRAWYAERDPNLESLWDDPRFLTLIAEMRAELERLRASL